MIQGSIADDDSSELLCRVSSRTLDVDSGLQVAILFVPSINELGILT